MTIMCTRLPTARLALAAAGVAVLLSSPAGTARAGSHAPAADPVAEVLRAVVGVRAEIRTDARTAGSLGTEREGSGVVIGADGLVLTIGYLILEAKAAEVLTPDGKAVPATVVGYDHDTGFGLLRADRPLGIKPVALGDSAALAEGDMVLIVSHEGAPPATPARVVSRRPFAGYWEYLLENAIFTAPPHPGYGGAALIGPDGRLLGIGSLFVNDAAAPATPGPGNMFVPIDGLKPILADLLEHGRPSRPSHPWLGLYTEQNRGRVFIVRVAAGGPAEKVGLKAGDIIMGVGGKRVRDMADFFRKVWARGDAGTEIPIDVLPMGAADPVIARVVVPSLDRYRWLRLEGGL
ncbi:MAG: S1C family serine protease [Alphaproteobacteria bacterium]|nr:S1C family serine protease [Alphaproteobacteria bacterium]